MDAFTRGLLDRIRATESDLTRAREEGDDFLAEVKQAELDALRVHHAAKRRIEELLDARQLTDQELTVARLASQGHSNREIASTLVLSVKTVEHLLSKAYTKLGVHSRLELTRHVR
jgi:DNA-binding NarL/FixJ family response regulator